MSQKHVDSMQIHATCKGFQPQSCYKKFEKCPIRTSCGHWTNIHTFVLPSLALIPTHNILRSCWEMAREHACMELGVIMHCMEPKFEKKRKKNEVCQKWRIESQGKMTWDLLLLCNGLGPVGTMRSDWKLASTDLRGFVTLLSSFNPTDFIRGLPWTSFRVPCWLRLCECPFNCTDATSLLFWGKKKAHFTPLQIKFWLPNFTIGSEPLY